MSDIEDIQNIPVETSDIIVDQLTTYGRYIIASQFPHRVDGLKQIHRRIIHVAKTFGEYGVASEKALGAIKELHDHGPTSIYDAAVRMSQIVHAHPPLIKIHGDNGSYAGEKAAASRYTKMSLQPFTHDLFYTGISADAIPVKTSTVDLRSKEPSYLIAAIPTTLWMGSITVGFGFNSKSAHRNFSDICDLTIAYCQYRLKHSPHFHKFPLHKYAHLYVPDFPVHGTLTNAYTVLEQYKQGKTITPLELEGTVLLTQSSVTIQTVPYGVPFKDIKSKIEQEITRKKGSWIDQNVIDINDYSDDPDLGCIEIKLKRNVNVFDAWFIIRDIIQFSATYHEKLNYCDEDGYMYDLDVLACLELWYRARFDLIAATKRRSLRALTTRVRILEAYLIIADHTDDVIRIIRENTKEDAAVALKEAFPALTQFQVDHLLKAQITILSKSSPIELKRDHDDLMKRIRDIITSFKTIPQEMIDTITTLKKRYPTPRRTLYPNYIGYMSIDHGCYQFRDHTEILDVMENFPRSTISIHMYDGSYLYHVDPRGRFLKGNIPKYTRGDIYGLPIPQEKVYTVTLVDGSISCVKGMVPGTRDRGFHYITRQAVVIYTDGRVEHVKIPDVLTIHKKLGVGVKSPILYLYSDIHKDKTHYIAICNSEDPNILWIRKVEDGRIPLSPVGSFYITHHYGSDNWYFTIPPEYLNRINVRVIHIPDVDRLMQNNTSLKVDLAARKSRHLKDMKLLQ